MALSRIPLKELVCCSALPRSLVGGMWWGMYCVVLCCVVVKENCIHYTLRYLWNIVEYMHVSLPSCL